MNLRVRNSTRKSSGRALALAHGGGDGVRDPAGVLIDDGGPGRARRARQEAEDARRSLFTLRGERHPGGLLRPSPSPGKMLREDAVDPAAEAPGRTEVGRQLQQTAALLEAVADGAVGLDVGAAEAIDGLLGIAHDEEAAGLRRELSPVLLLRVLARQVEEDLGLDRVGVLELVDEDGQEAFLEGAPDTGMVAEQVAGDQEQVLEVEPAVAAAPRGELVRRGRHGAASGSGGDTRRQRASPGSRTSRHERFVLEPQAPGLRRFLDRGASASSTATKAGASEVSRSATRRAARRTHSWYSVQPPDGISAGRSAAGAIQERLDGDVARLAKSGAGCSGPIAGATSSLSESVS